MDRVPNWEAGAWPQTTERWEGEGLPPADLHWDWFYGEAALGMDPREFIRFTGKMIPAFDYEELAEDETTVTFRDEKGIVRRALKEGSIGGARMSMDNYIGFPVTNRSDWELVKRRYPANSPQRYEPNWETCRVPGWHARQHPLIFGPNCSTLGFYWIARELLGFEALSFAWYDQPELMHDIMEFWADFLIEAARPVLAQTTDRIHLPERRSGHEDRPVAQPAELSHLHLPAPVQGDRLLQGPRRALYLRRHGREPGAADPDDARCRRRCAVAAGAGSKPRPQPAAQGVWPVAAAVGRGGQAGAGAKGADAIDEHLKSLQPLIEEGGFIPTVDHTVPPDVSWDNFQYYMERKMLLLEAKL